jgi:hypothetical protein
MVGEHEHIVLDDGSAIAGGRRRNAVRRPSSTDTYTFTNNTAYQTYRLRMTANNGATSTQLTEIQMFDN